MSKEQEQFALFWRGEFSQWAPSPFSVDGVEYSCAEQYMMAEKARMFNNQESLDAIMATKDPRTMKKLGRGVKGFDKEVWEKEAKAIVYRGNYAKFTQDQALYDLLRSTAGLTLVEASPYDRVWGIGLGEDDPRARDRSQWLGTNWLGEVLTQLREVLMELRED